MKKIKVISTITIVFALLIIIIRLFVGEIIFITSSSMFPTFTCGDKILINKWKYGVVMPRCIKDIPILNTFCLIPNIDGMDKKIDFGYHRINEHKLPERMDIVLFKWENSDKQLYIKRVIGIPGDTIEIKKGKVYINNKLLKRDVTDVLSKDNHGPLVVCEQSYFVLGDCRTNSIDSRNKGLVKFENIIGKASYKLDKGKLFNKWKNLYY